MAGLGRHWRWAVGTREVNVWPGRRDRGGAAREPRREELCGEPSPPEASFATRSWISATSLLQIAQFSLGFPPLCC